MAALALFLVVSGGTAFAAFVIHSNSEVKPNTISGANRPSGFPNDNIVAGSVGASDIAPGARTHKLEFSASSKPAAPPFPPDVKQATLTTAGNVKVDVLCESTPNTIVYLTAKNVTRTTATMNTVLGYQTSRDGAVTQYITGQAVGAGKSATIDKSDFGDNALVSGSSNFNRAEGQVVFQTPGRVTTIHFHVGVLDPHCEVSGTAVTSGSS
jgi:hypothetical protein